MIPLIHSLQNPYLRKHFRINNLDSLTKKLQGKKINTGEPTDQMGSRRYFNQFQCVALIWDQIQTTDDKKQTKTYKIKTWRTVNKLDFYDHGIIVKIFRWNNGIMVMILVNIQTKIFLHS